MRIEGIENRRSAMGFTLVEIMIVVAIIGVLASISMPNLARARVDAQSKACVSNLRTIEGAKEVWALERGYGGFSVAKAEDIRPYIGRGQLGTLPVCPADPFKSFVTSYNINRLNAIPTCVSSGTALSHSLLGFYN